MNSMVSLTNVAIKDNEEEDRLDFLIDLENQLESLKDPFVLKEKLKDFIKQRNDYLKESYREPLRKYPLLRLALVLEKAIENFFLAVYPRPLKYKVVEPIQNQHEILSYNVKKKVQNADRILEKSDKFMDFDYFQTFIKLVNSLKKNDDDFKFDQLICYNLRSFINYSTARKHLYFLICLKKILNIEKCKVYGSIKPTLTPKDVKILKDLNIEIDENLDKDVRKKYDHNIQNKKTLVYTPYNEMDKISEEDQLFKENCNSNALKNLCLISFKFNFYMIYFFGNAKYKLKIVRENQIESYGKKAFNNFFMYKFDVSNISEDQLQKYADIELKEYPEVKEETSDQILEKANDFMKSDEFKKFSKNLRRLRKKNFYTHFDEIISLGLGYFNQHYSSRYELYLLLGLKKIMNFEKQIEIYDPIFSKNEIEILKKLDFKVTETNKGGKIEIKDKKTLFFMKNTPSSLENEIIKSNWNIESLKNLYFFGSGLKCCKIPSSYYEDSMYEVEVYSKRISHLYISAKILKIVDEKRCLFNFSRFETSKLKPDDLNKHFSDKLPADYDYNNPFYLKLNDDDIYLPNFSYRILSISVRLLLIIELIIFVIMLLNQYTSLLEMIDLPFINFKKSKKV